jgi:chromosome segregation ATPase
MELVDPMPMRGRCAKPRPSTVAVLLSLFVTAFGCSKKVPECNALIEQINSSATAMEAATREFSSSKQSKEASDKFARANQAELDKIGKVALTLPELQGFSKNYQALLGSVATAATSIGRSNGELEELMKTVQKSQADWMAAGTRVTAACQKAQKECNALGDKLAAPPALTGNLDENAKKLEAYAKGLASIEVKNAEVQAAARELEKAVVELVARLNRSSVAQKDYERALKALSDINAKEPALIQGINDFCQAK